MSEFQSDILDKKYDEDGDELDKHGFKVKKYPDGLESVRKSVENCEMLCGLSERDALNLAIKTWPKGITPCTHYSESRRKEKLDESIKAQAHSDLIKDTIQTYGLDIDVVVEAKHKELAVLNYYKLGNL